MVFSILSNSLNLLSISAKRIKIEPTVLSNLTSPHLIPTFRAISSPISFEILGSSIVHSCSNIVSKSILFFTFLYSIPERQVATMTTFLSIVTLSKCSKFWCSTNLCKSSITTISVFLGNRKVSRFISMHLGIAILCGLFNLVKAS